MSGIVGASQSKNGNLGYISKEWKHLYRADLRSTKDGGGNTIDFHAAHGLKNGTFTFYKLIGAGIRGNDGTARELGLRWSCVSSATTGYATNGYYGARWAQHHDTSTFTTAALANAASGRVCYLNSAGGTNGVTGMEILLSNPGVGDPTGGVIQSGAVCHTHGYVHSTSSVGHGGVTSYIINNNGSADSTGSNGEISAISLTVNAGTFGTTSTGGTVDLYGLVK